MANKRKLCTITNDPFTYIMEVDGVTICFGYSFEADYFIRHYKELGYEVKFIDRTNDEPQNPTL